MYIYIYIFISQVCGPPRRPWQWSPASCGVGGGVVGACDTVLAAPDQRCFFSLHFSISGMRSCSLATHRATAHVRNYDMCIVQLGPA